MAVRFRSLAFLGITFGLGIAVGAGANFVGQPAGAQDRDRPNPYAEMLHVGIVVPDLEEAVERWEAMGFTGIRVLEPSAGRERRYRGEPIDTQLKQAFITGTDPMIELMEPAGEDPGPWGDYLAEHGEAIHHLAFRIPETGPELERFAALGMPELAGGKWPEGEDHWGTFHYVQDPEGGVIVEFISRVPRD